MTVTVAGSGEKRKDEIQVLTLKEPTLQVMGRSIHKTSEDRQTGMRSLLLKSQSHGGKSSS